MGRPLKLTDATLQQDLITGATYGPAGQLLTMSGQVGESRTYNSLNQLIALSSNGVSMAYVYPSTQNNGKISSQTDYISGEQAIYTYDALNRLASASGGSSGSTGATSVAFWRLDEASGATSFTDASGNGNAGSCSGANCPTMGVAGQVGTAGSFNGTSSVVNLGTTNAALRPSGAVSVAAWIKASTSQNAFPQIFSNGDSTGLTGYNLYVQNGGGQGAAAFIVKESSTSWGSCYAQGTTNLKDNAWHFVVGVYSGSAIKIYVDGVLQTTGTCQNTGISYGTSPQADIGKKIDASSNDYFTGVIDEVRVFNQALSDTDVTALNGFVPNWGQSYTYDGFGNLTDQNVTAGSAPAYHVVPEPATNHLGSTDANGNQTTYLFDVENRMTTDNLNFPNWRYSYAPGNKRVWRGVWTWNGGSSTLVTDEVTFWSVSGQKLATYQLSVNGTQLLATQTGTNYYFGGKMVKKASGWVGTDRLGSVGKFYPFGQEKPSATTNGTEKFATYFRDAETGLDYADQRYHGPGTGRFMTPDPYMASGGPGNPGSWNRYSYTHGDPIKYTDPRGLLEQEDCNYSPDFCNIGPPQDPFCPVGYHYDARVDDCVPNGGGGGGGGGNGFVDTTGQAKKNARDRLANNSDCYKLIFENSKWNTVAKAQQQLDIRDVELKDLGSPQIVGTSDKWGANVEWGGNDGATIYLNSQLFPDDTTAKFDVFGQKKSSVDLFNHTYDVNLTGVQVEEAIILHELWHIAGGTDDNVIDAFENKVKLIKTCIK